VSGGLREVFSPGYPNGGNGPQLEVIDVGGRQQGSCTSRHWSVQGKAMKDGQSATFSGIATQRFERQRKHSLKLRLHTYNLRSRRFSLLKMDALLPATTRIILSGRTGNICPFSALPVLTHTLSTTRRCDAAFASTECETSSPDSSHHVSQAA